jgi:hypothetical protein
MFAIITKVIIYFIIYRQYFCVNSGIFVVLILNKIKMKTRIRVLLLLMVWIMKSYGQDSLIVKTDSLHRQIFSLSPIAKNVDQVNGLVLGIGHFENCLIQKQTINGLNIEANPMGLLFPFFMFFSFDERFDHLNYFKEDKITTQVNGLNISSGGFMNEAKMNGFNISTLTKLVEMNGVSISGFMLVSKNVNGISISGIHNFSESLNGVSIGFINQTINLKGVQIGVFNISEKQMNGIQIGVYNKSVHKKGLQIGFWNKNNKRALPFINW